MGGDALSSIGGEPTSSKLETHSYSKENKLFSNCKDDNFKIPKD
jgi:hypothetical protein